MELLLAYDRLGSVVIRAKSGHNSNTSKLDQRSPVFGLPKAAHELNKMPRRAILPCFINLIRAELLADAA